MSFFIVHPFRSPGCAPQTPQPTNLARTSLTRRGIHEVFSLQRVDGPYFAVPKEDLLPVPAHLEYLLESYEAEMPDHARKITGRVTNIIMASVAQQMRAEGSAEGAPGLRAQYNLTSGRKLALVVRGHVGGAVEAAVDWTYWYDDMKKSTAVGLAVFVVKGASTMESGVVKCLNFLAMIHKIRKTEGCDMVTIHGIVSDGYDFTFLTVDKDSKYFQWTPSSDWSESKESIYFWIRAMIRDVRTFLACTSHYHTESQEGKGSIVGVLGEYRLSAPEV